MAFWKWSRTASSNATADNTINWAEGMAPSAVNDSARAMMARLAEWRDDIAGTIVTAGTSIAYTVASNQGFDNFADLNGAMIAFTPHTTNGATVTLNVDGLGAEPLRYSPSLELQSGVLIQGTPYVASYNNSDGAFYLQGGFADPYGVPLGGMLDYIGPSAPNSACALPAGQAISRTTYATLFSLVGTTFGSGDGSTTFNVPDLRGRTTFGVDDMGGSAAGRLTGAGGNYNGTILGNAGGAQNQTLTIAQLPVHTPSGTVGITDPQHAHVNFTNVGAAGGSNALEGSSGGSNATFAPGTVAASTGITATFTGNSFGSGSSHPIIPPSMAVMKILRVILKNLLDTRLPGGIGTGSWLRGAMGSRAQIVSAIYRLEPQ